MKFMHGKDGYTCDSACIIVLIILSVVLSMFFVFSV